MPLLHLPAIVDSRGNERSNLKPINLRLWNMIVMQAKMRFQKYPSPAASNWVHKKYVEDGGKFLPADDPRYKKIMARENERNNRMDHAANIHRHQGKHDNPG